MNRSVKKLIEAIIYWFFAMIFFFTFRYIGLEDEEGIQVSDEVLEINDHFILVALLGGVIFGIFHFVVQVITSSARFKRKSFGQTILIRAFLYFVTIVVTGNVLIATMEGLFSTQIATEPLVFTKGFWSFGLFFTLMSLLYLFFEMVSEKFGRGVLLKMMLGSYRAPKEENRVFMFIDLKSSTTIAEKLGHFDYSKLIQQCFYDLNEVVEKCEGEIYQYVGDEAVISWPHKSGVSNNNCIDCFFEFQRKLESRREFYEEKFGLLPEFKAGMHGGKLIVTEVGVMKKEIAYHGDVINTAARIQVACNKFGEKLLMSEVLSSQLSLADYEVKPLGEVELKGKLAPVKIVAVA